jgi:hypothetical protein
MARMTTPFGFSTTAAMVLGPTGRKRRPDPILVTRTAKKG